MTRFALGLMLGALAWPVGRLIGCIIFHRSIITTT